MSTVVRFTQENFDREIGAAPMAVVDFWAPWCAPCRAFAPTFEAAAVKHPDIVFGKVNTEDEQELAATFNIRSIPTLMVFRERVIIYAEAGALPPAMLEEVIAKAQELDMAKVHEELAAEEQALSSSQPDS